MKRWQARRHLYSGLLFRAVIFVGAANALLSYAQGGDDPSGVVERSPSWTSGTMSMQELASRAHEGQERLLRLESEYQIKMQAILDDTGSLGNRGRQRAINQLENELKRQKVSIWAQSIEPFNQAVMDKANEGLSVEDRVKPTGGSQLFAKDRGGNTITQPLNNGAGEIKVYNGTFKAADLDIGCDGPNCRQVAAKVDSIYRQYGFSPSNTSRFSADYDDARVTINIAPGTYQSGSNMHRAEINAQANNYESFVSHGCKQFNGECPGKKLVLVNDVNSKGLTYLHGNPQNLLGFENQDKLSNAAKSTLKALKEGGVTEDQLASIARDKGFTPDQFKTMLTELKENGRTFAGVGINESNVDDFQAMARAVTQQAADNALADWEVEREELRSQRKGLEAEFNAARDMGAPEEELSRIRNTMREIDDVMTDAQVRVDATSKVNRRLINTASSTIPESSRVRNLMSKVKSTAANAAGAAGTWLRDTGFDQATKSAPTLVDATKSTFKPGLLGTVGHAFDAYQLYECSQDPNSSSRQVCYWKNGSSVVFNTFSDIGVAGSAGLGAGGMLGTGTMSGLVTVGAPLLVTGVAGQQVTELVGEVKEGEAAALREKFNTAKGEERTLATILAGESAARQALNDYRATGDWQYLRTAMLQASRFRRLAKISGDNRYAQSANLLERTAGEYQQLIATGTTAETEFDFEGEQLGQLDDTELQDFRVAGQSEEREQQKTADSQTSGDSLSFDQADRAVADQEARLAVIEKNKRETQQIYSNIERDRERREQANREFWQIMGAVASSVSEVATEYAEQKRIMDQTLEAKKAEIASQASADYERLQNQLSANPCERWKSSPADYQRCLNDPCAKYVDYWGPYQSCVNNQRNAAEAAEGQVPVVATENMHEGVCNERYGSGSNAPEQYVIPITPSTNNRYVYEYQHETIKDRARVYFNEQLVMDTRCTSGGKKWGLPDMSGGGTVRIVIDPKCDPAAGNSETIWSFKLVCS